MDAWEGREDARGRRREVVDGVGEEGGGGGGVGRGEEEVVRARRQRIVVTPQTGWSSETLGLTS